MVYSALQVAKKLSFQSIRAGVIDLFRIKPLNEKMIWDVVKKVGYIVTLEEHSIIGGIGSVISEMLIVKKNIPAFKPIGMPNQFCRKYGRREYLQCLYKLDVNSIAKSIKVWIKSR